MGFSKIVQKFHADTASQDALLALERAKENSKRIVQLNELVETIDPIVRPILGQFAEEASNDGYFSKSDFHKEDYRCWWYFSFVPDKNSQPNDFVQKDCTALVRLHDDGQASLEWAFPHYWHVHHELRFRKLPAHNLNTKDVQTWIEEFVAYCLQAQQTRDRKS